MSLEDQTTIEPEAPAAAEAPAQAAPAEAPSTRESLAGIFAEQLAAERAGSSKAAPAEAAAPQTESEPDEGAVADQDGTDPESGTETSTTNPIVNAPVGMSEEDRQRFAQLTPEVQAWVTQRENQRHADYTRKTQEAAELAKSANAERQKLNGQLQQYDAFLSSITQQRIEPPDPNLQYTDPDGYQQLLGQYVTAKHRQEQAVAEQQRVVSERKQIEQQHYSEFVKSESQKLVQIMPEYGDAKKAPELRKAVIAYAEENGFAEALGRATAAEIKVLTQSMRFEAAQKAAKAANPVAQVAPRMTKPSPARAPGRGTGITSAVQNLTSNPSRNALAAAYLADIRSER